MGIARIQPGVAMLGGRIYAVGGEQGSQILANGEVYDPAVYLIIVICLLIHNIVISYWALEAFCYKYLKLDQNFVSIISLSN